MKPLEKILLIEDDSEVKLVTELSLREMSGTQLVSCESGKEGLEQAHSYIPDLILLDITMPDMNGFVFHKKIREDTTIGKTPIVFFTAADQKSVENYIQQEKDPYLLGTILKPFDPLTLPKLLEDMWEKFMRERDSLDF